MRSVTSKRRPIAAILATVIVAAATAVFLTASPAPAEPTWDEGTVATRPLRCVNTPYEIHGRVDWLHDAASGSPMVGEPYFVQVAIWSDLPPAPQCLPTLGTIDLTLPGPNTAPAIDAASGAELGC